MDSSTETNRLSSSDRQSVILEAVGRSGSCTIADLMVRLSVSDETIRRDIRTLEKEGFVRKTHGGVAALHPLRDPGFRRRLAEHPDAKRLIAKAAADLVREGDTLLLDAGSTNTFLAYALANRRNLLVVTNSIEIARILTENSTAEVFVTGGKLRAEHGGVVGSWARKFIEQFNLHIAFISAGGIDLVAGLTDYTLDDAEFTRTIIRRAKRSIVLADHSKFGRRALVSVCDFHEIDMLITDQVPTDSMYRRLEEEGVTICAGS